MTTSRRQLLSINAASLLVLASGVLNSWVVPKLALSALGVPGYGVVALLLGFTLLPSFADLGLSASLTRELGRAISAGDLGGADSVFRSFLLMGAALSTSLAAAGVVLGSILGLDSAAPCGIALGAGANCIVFGTELCLMRVRVAGRLVGPAIAKSTYYVANLTVITTLYASGLLGIRTFFASQLLAAIVYLFVGVGLFRSTVSLQPQSVTKLALPWRRLARLSLPEQLNRAQSSFLPGVERTAIAANGSTSAVAAYDLAIRLSLLATALPAALSEPVLALLAPRGAADKSSERELIFRHGFFAALITASVSGVGAVAVIWTVAPWFFSVPAEVFGPMATLVAVGSAVNCVSAPIASALLAEGSVRPLVLKSTADATMACIGLGVMTATRSPLDYVWVRYAGLMLTSGVMVLWYVRARGRPCLAKSA